MQTKISDVNQIQQNVNKVLTNINNQITDLQSSVNQLEILGEIKLSALSLSQFQAFAGDSWIAANGQSCVGTDYAKEFSVTTVPNISISGTNAYIKVTI